MTKIEEQIINQNYIDIDDLFESEWIDYQRDYLERFMVNSMVSGYVTTNKEKFIKSIMNKKNIEKIEKEIEKKNLFTMKQMCEHIVKADILQFKDDKSSPTAEEIFNYSPTGELYMVFQWFNEACHKIGLPETN